MRPSRAATALLGLAAVALTSPAWTQPAPPAGAPPPALPAAVNRLLVVVNGLRSDNGLVRVGLYNTPARWPRANENFKFCNARIHGRRAACEIADVTPGAYAIAMTHDENGNNHFDQGFLGWPLEGYGFSNNVRPHLLGAPSFDSARFVYRGGPPLTVTMTMQY